MVHVKYWNEYSNPTIMSAHWRTSDWRSEGLVFDPRAPQNLYCALKERTLNVYSPRTIYCYDMLSLCTLNGYSPMTIYCYVIYSMRIVKEKCVKIGGATKSKKKKKAFYIPTYNWQNILIMKKFILINQYNLNCNLNVA